MRYESFIGELGRNLSGGHKQRVLLARALFRQPQALFLGEATSHLDVPMERQVNRNLQSLSMTRISIAHRPETIASAGRVTRLERGRITLSADERQVVPLHS